MYVVPAGMHDSGLYRLIGNLVGFLDGERVDVRPQGHHPLFRVMPLDQAYYSVVSNAVLMRNAVFTKLFRDIFPGFHFFIRKFRILMQVPADTDGVLMIGIGQFLDFIF